MIITTYNPLPAVSAADVEAYASKLKIGFDSGLASFLVEHNGGAPLPRWFPLPKRLVSTLSQVDDYLVVDQLAGCLPSGHKEHMYQFDDLIALGPPISSRASGFPTLRIGISEPSGEIWLATGPTARKGEVYYFTNDGTGEVRLNFTVYKLSPSFRHFVKKFEYPPPLHPWLEMIHRGDVHSLAAWLEAGGDPSVSAHNSCNEFGACLANH